MGGTSRYTALDESACNAFERAALGKLSPVHCSERAHRLGSGEGKTTPRLGSGRLQEGGDLCCLSRRLSWPLCSASLGQTPSPYDPPPCAAAKVPGCLPGYAPPPASVRPASQNVRLTGLRFPTANRYHSSPAWDFTSSEIASCRPDVRRAAALHLEERS